MPAVRIALLVALAAGPAVADEPKKPTSKIKPDKAVTFVTEPLDEDGYVDYEAALNKVLKGKATPQTNAIVMLLKVFGPKPEGAELRPAFYEALGVTAPPEKGDYLVSWNKFFGDVARDDPNGFDKLNELESRLRKQPWTPTDSPKHIEYLKANEKPLAIAVEATKLPHYYHPLIARTPDGKRTQLIGSLLPMVQKGREIASLLSFRATLKLGEGKVDEAFADALTMHRLSRHMGRGGTLIELLVGIAIGAIAHNTELAILEHGKPSATQALAYQAELLKLPKMPTTLDKINQGERFMGLDAVTWMARHGVQGNGGEFFGGIGELAGGTTPEEMTAALDFELILRRMNEGYDRLTSVAEKPTHAERKAANAAWEKELKDVRAKLQNMTPLQKFFLMAERPEKRREKVSENVAAVLVGLLMPAIHKVGEASLRGEQTYRNGLIATALAAHFADKKAYPDKLADLVPKYLAKVPGDAFSDNELNYKKTDTGYLLYAVGANGKDDGGKLLTEEPADGQPRGDDIGVRMPRK